MSSITLISPSCLARPAVVSSSPCLSPCPPDWPHRALRSSNKLCWSHCRAFTYVICFARTLFLLIWVWKIIEVSGLPWPTTSSKIAILPFFSVLSLNVTSSFLSVTFVRHICYWPADFLKSASTILNNMPVIFQSPSLQACPSCGQRL